MFRLSSFCVDFILTLLLFFFLQLYLVLCIYSNCISSFVSATSQFWVCFTVYSNVVVLCSRSRSESEYERYRRHSEHRPGDSSLSSSARLFTHFTHYRCWSVGKTSSKINISLKRLVLYIWVFCPWECSKMAELLSISGEITSRTSQRGVVLWWINVFFSGGVASASSIFSFRWRSEGDGWW